MKSQINSIKQFGKLTNIWKLNNTFLNHQWVKEGITMEIIKYFEINENGIQHTKT